MNLTAQELRSREKASAPFHYGNHLDFSIPSGAPPADAKMLLGQRVYYNSCVYCHGVEGKGQGALICAKSPLVGKEITPETIIQTLKAPVFPMPSLRLLPEEQEAVAAYVRARMTSGAAAK